MAVKKGKGITVFLLHEIEELRGQIISELLEGGLEFRPVDRTGSIFIKVLEDTLPVLDVFPEPRELRRKHK